MILSKEQFKSYQPLMKDMFERSAKALEMLEYWDCISIDTDDNTIVGRIVGLKENDVLIKVIAAREIDFKMRNLSTKGSKKRTYPLPLHRIISCKEVMLDEVPLYVNFKYLSPQFKNKYLKKG